MQLIFKKILKNTIQFKLTVHFERKGFSFLQKNSSLLSQRQKHVYIEQLLKIQIQAVARHKMIQMEHMRKYKKQKEKKWKK